jgi:DNA-binding CsgD family transcriptional regulator
MNSINKILNKFFKNNNYYVLKDLNSNYIGCSESVAEEAGLDSPKGIKGKNDHEMIWKDAAESFVKADNELILKRKIKINTLEMIQGSSGMHKVLVSKTGLRKDNGDLVAIISTNIIIDDIDVDIRKKTGKLSNDEQKFYLGAAWGEKHITKREVQVLKCILHGFSSKKMASLLNLSKKRIECIIKQLKQKLQCRSQLEIVSRAIIEGWIYLLEEDLQLDPLAGKNKKIS